MEPLQIVSHTDQVPLQGNFLQSTQRELLKTQNPLNNPNDWFDTGLAGYNLVRASRLPGAKYPLSRLDGRSESDRLLG